MTLPVTRLGAALVLAATALLATACSSSAPDPESSATPTPTTAPSAPTPEPTETAAAEADDPTCETIIPASTVADFASVGWTANAAPFYLGDLEITEGLQCVWADYDGPAGDHLQLFGWAPIDSGDAAAAQDSLVNQGWIREDSAEGVYITENPETTIATDENGYGMTYLFVAGAVKLADTKQGLILIDWPKS